eukprot:4492523-Amphidinium_carterae.1
MAATLHRFQARFDRRFSLSHEVHLRTAEGARDSEPIAAASKHWKQAPIHWIALSERERHITKMGSAAVLKFRQRSTSINGEPNATIGGLPLLCGHQQLVCRTL